MSEQTKSRERDMEHDWRINMQTKAWQRRFKALTLNSPDHEWMWVILHFDGDQDDLDHLFNEYGKHGEGDQA